jgi:hypothetical protein
VARGCNPLGRALSVYCVMPAKSSVSTLREELFWQLLGHFSRLRSSGEPIWSLQQRMCPLRITKGFKLTRRPSGIVQLFCFPSAKRITIVSAIEVHAGVAAQKDQLEDDALEWATPSMTVYIEAPTLGALSNSRARVPHVSQCWGKLNRLGEHLSNHRTNDCQLH